MLEQAIFKPTLTDQRVKLMYSIQCTSLIPAYFALPTDNWVLRFLCQFLRMRRERAKWRLSAGHQSTWLITMQGTLHATILNHPLQQQDSEAVAAKCMLDKPKHLNSFGTILTLLWYPCLGSVDSFRSCWRFWWGRDWQIKYWILFNTNTIW